jgi:membrane-associated PAP2 superfamily phosphatase
MTLEQIFFFWQEWGALIALFLFVALFMAVDLFPKITAFIAEVERAYPGIYEKLEQKEQAVIDQYERLPTRIRAGFALLGGKAAWASLVRTVYRYIRNKSSKLKR